MLVLPEINSFHLILPVTLLLVGGWMTPTPSQGPPIPQGGGGLMGMTMTMAGGWWGGEPGTWNIYIYIFVTPKGFFQLETSTSLILLGILESAPRSCGKLAGRVQLRKLMPKFYEFMEYLSYIYCKIGGNSPIAHLKHPETSGKSDDQYWHLWFLDSSQPFEVRSTNWLVGWLVGWLA